MLSRNFLLQVTLASLAVAAILGIVSVLIAASDVGSCMVGSALLTAAAAGLLIPLSALARNKSWRRAGILSVLLLLGQYLLILASIWWHQLEAWNPGLSTHDVQIRFLLTAVALLPTGLMAAISLRGLATSLTSLAGWIAAVSAGLTLMAWGVAIWGDLVWQRFPFPEEHWAETGLVLGAFGALAAGCTVGLRLTLSSTIRWLGVAAAVLGVTMALGSIWLVPAHHETLFVAVTAVAVAISIANPLCIPTAAGATLAVRRLTVAALIAAAALTVLTTYLKQDVFVQLDLVPRLTLACGIAATCGVMATVILLRLNQLPALDLRAEAPVFTNITVACPRCRRKNRIALGEDRCQRCGLIIRVSVQQPRCPKCGYLLYAAQSNQCPDCGQPLAAAPAVPTDAG